MRNEQIESELVKLVVEIGYGVKNAVKDLLDNSVFANLSRNSF
jgi:hypothetical protein